MLCLSFYMFNCIFAATPTNAESTPPTHNLETARSIPVYTGNAEEVLRQFFKNSTLSFEENEHRVPGDNHLTTGFFTVGHQRIFCMQRRYDDYGENPPFCPIDPANNIDSFYEKLVQALDVLEKTGIVPLIERILQTETIQKSSEAQEEAVQIQCYIEFYPHVEGADGSIWLRDALHTSNDEIMKHIMKSMGVQVGRMFADEIPHPDCHPENFLIDPELTTYAIDCRDRMRSLDLINPTPPALLFLGVTAGIIRQTLGETITDPEMLKKTYSKIFTECRQVFIKGLVEGVGANIPGERQRHTWVPLEILTTITDALVSPDFSEDNDFSGKTLAITEQITRRYFQEIASAPVSASASPQQKHRPKPRKFTSSDDDEGEYATQQLAAAASSSQAASKCHPISDDEGDDSEHATAGRLNNSSAQRSFGKLDW